MRNIIVKDGNGRKAVACVAGREIVSVLFYGAEAVEVISTLYERGYK